MKNLPEVATKAALSVAKDMNITGKNGVVLILGLGTIWLINQAMEKGYAFVGSYSKDEKIEVKFSPPDKPAS